MAIKLYEGSAVGTRAQVAVATDGSAFVRYWTMSKWGPKWGKWSAFVPTFPTVVYSKIEGQENVSYSVAAGSRVSVGFADIPLVTDDARVRLPR